VAEPDGISRSWSDLHRLRASFDAPLGVAARAAMRGLARSLGATAVPLCARALAGDAERRAYAVELLRAIAAVAYGRVVDELRAVVARPASDDAKLTALALLAELGDETTTGALRRSAPGDAPVSRWPASPISSTSPAEIASAADLLVSRLGARRAGRVRRGVLRGRSRSRARSSATSWPARVDLDVNARGELGARDRAAQADDARRATAAVPRPGPWGAPRSWSACATPTAAT
jgi:hypothetical protein